MSDMRMVPVRVRKSMVRQLSYQILNKYNITEPGVPIREILKDYARVFYYDGDQNAGRQESGFCIYDGESYRVYLNQNSCAGRGHFSHAHELGHIVTRHLIDYDIKNLSESQIKLIDREADLFSVHIMMPEHTMRKYVDAPLNISTIGYYKDLFNVSWEAFGRRLIELEMISYAELQSIYKYPCKLPTSEKNLIQL